MKWLKPIFFITLSFIISNCGGGNSTTSPPIQPPTVGKRSFLMGFTPWPYDATIEAVNTTYEKAQQNGDIINHHIMQGIPWQQALDNTSYPANVEDEINSRISQTIAGKIILIELGSINGLRTGLANNWGQNGEEARTVPWDNRNFDSPEVISAYSNFALDLIARFNPEYFNYGTEASELILSDINEFNKFKIFAQQVYANIKAQYPNIKLMISVALKSPDSNESSLLQQHIPELLDYVDVIGVSVYPYIFFNHNNKGDPANLPADWLTQITQIAPGKPVAITETGWIAKNLVIDNFSVNVTSNETFQKNYVSRLLQESNNLNSEFVIWWSLIDYQALWEGVLNRDDLAAIWRDIGLYDEQVQPRSGLTTWQQFLARVKQ